MFISVYRCMWVLTMFDLPVDTKEARRAYAQFRKALLKDGFSRLQFSVYARHCASEENADVHTERVQHVLPDDGEVRVLAITDKQFGLHEERGPEWVRWTTLAETSMSRLRQPTNFIHLLFYAPVQGGAQPSTNPWLCSQELAAAIADIIPDVRFAFSCEHPYPSSQTTTWMLAEDQMEIGERPASQVLRCFALCSSAQ